MDRGNFDQPRVQNNHDMTSNVTYTGKVVISPHYDLAEVECILNGEKRRIPINTPSGYHPQHALKDKHVKFTLYHDPAFSKETKFANIHEILPCPPVL